MGDEICRKPNRATAILAIDAAWTHGEPSGVALLERVVPGRWTCRALAPSYATFEEVAAGRPVDWHESKFFGNRPDPEQLLSAASRILDGRTPDLVTVDMPVATVPILGRRLADQLISQRFGGNGCGTHSPSPTRPGQIGSIMSEGLRKTGYELALANTRAGTTSRLVEVYPHPALLTLLHVDYRVSYKVSKSCKYWPETSLSKRIGNLVEIFETILVELRRFIECVPLEVPPPHQIPKLNGLKRYEDAIDALICGWTGIRYLEGAIEAFGDNTSAIWVPRDREE